MLGEKGKRVGNYNVTPHQLLLDLEKKTSLPHTVEFSSIEMNFQPPTYHFEFKPIKLDFEIEALNISSFWVSTLKNKIQKVKNVYLIYTLTYCQYSLFHVHGSAGRKRVNDWVNKIELISDSSSL